MTDAELQVPEEIKAAIREHGFHKLASVVFGVDVSDRHAVIARIGEKLAARNAENKAIKQGLEALVALRKG